MDSIFQTILNMSFTGAFVIAAICLARLPLKKAPKTISYCMWGAAGFRLVFPFSVESAVSLMPFGSRPIAQSGSLAGLANNIGKIPGAVGSFITNPATPGAAGELITNVASPGAAGNFITAAASPGVAAPSIPWLTICSYVWLAGVIVMIVCGVASVFKLKRNIGSATSVIANVYEAQSIRTPFILGFFPPTIYIPAGLTEREKTYVIKHENKHIMRRDHITKVISYFILCIHWFNPLAWVAFRLMSADMEMSCDEAVLKNMGSGPKIIYAQSLLTMALNRRYVSNSLIAFGGKGVKKRVRNILRLRNYPSVAVIAAVVLATVFSLGLSLDRPGGTALMQQPADGIADLQSKNADGPGLHTEIYTSEAYTNNFGRVPGSKIMPPLHYYQYKNANGDVSVYAYFSTD